MQIDFGKTANDYATHRAGFPDSFFTRIAEYGVGQSAQTIVDIGTGTGTLARGFARRGCNVIGIDPAENMLQQARALTTTENLSVVFRCASAEQTHLPDAFADVVTAGQCWHWFNDTRAAQESRRILKRDGRIVIAHFDWIPLRVNVVEATEQLILKHNPNWKMSGTSGIYGAWLRDLAEAGFCNLQTFSYDLFVPYTHEGWRGRIRASAGIAASLSPEAVAAFDAEHAEMLRTQFTNEPLQTQHRVWALIGERG
jgi:SAM-dependent methyltransferase